MSNNRFIFDQADKRPQKCGFLKNLQLAGSGYEQDYQVDVIMTWIEKELKRT